MEPSIFTKIINGEIACHKIYEDDEFLAFLDIHPLTTGHTLVIPKTQIDSLWDLPDETYIKLWKKAKELAPYLSESIACKRIAIVVEGFGVPHAHVHLIPTNSAVDLKGKQDLGSEPDHANLASLATEIRDKISNKIKESIE